MFTNNKRISTLLFVSVLMNFILFSIAYLLNLPLWLDTTGTIYVSAILGFPAGFIAAIINNVTQAFLFYGRESVFFYFVSALTAFISGWVMKRYGERRYGRWLILMALLIVVDVSAAIGITFLVNDGVPSNYWSLYLYESCLQRGMSGALSTALAVGAVKLPDVIVSVLIVAVFYRLTPEKYRGTSIAIME